MNRMCLFLAGALCFAGVRNLAALERTVWASSVTIEQDIPRIKSDGKVLKLIAAKDAPEDVKKKLAEAKNLVHAEKSKDHKYVIVRGTLQGDEITVKALDVKDGRQPKNGWPEDADMTPDDKKQYEDFTAELKKEKKANKKTDNKKDTDKK